MFELGFFSPGKSKNRYLGIWYKKISYRTVVWVANRNKPIADTSGMLKLSRLGNLLIQSDGNPMVWSSNSTVSVEKDNLVVVKLQVLDNGNLVVWNKNEMIWQSFDYPGDTYLPGMKIGKDLVTGLQRCLTSWKSPDDPSVGMYKDVHDTDGYPQTLGWRGEDLVARLGPWNGLGFSGFPIEKENKIYSSEFVMNEKEIYHTYALKSSVIQRIVLTWDGKTLFLHWIERTKDWLVYANAVVDNCDQFSLCGPFGICSINKHPPCTCMQGFEPRNPEAWEASDWARGCIRKKPLQCGNKNGNGDEDGFWKIERVKLPDTRWAWHNASMTFEECKMTCKRNCSCTGYTSLDIRNGGSGCLLWLDKLLDTREYEVDQDIYIRMAASEIEGLVKYQSNLNIRRRILTLLPLTKTMKTPHMEKEGNTKEQLMPTLLHESCMSMIRRIQGMLKDGREVAVKRLAETSQQGLDEFKNEVICIAKLQHRNLVKLLGYCIHQNELMLIYEYLPNKRHDTVAKTKKVVGTYGYISPEYAVHGRFSTKSDVFSFGVLVLEIISGKRNREFSHGDHSDNLLGHAWRLYKVGRSIELMSASLQASSVVFEVLRSIQVALLCVQHYPADRPTMWSVVLMLVSEGPLPEPKPPAFFTDESCSELESLPSVDERTITLLVAR
ncbi:hypothetical protein M8C21_028154 [Ambrosia artemisiifolia]|uniref:Receptor-like serine/threonine-protein kinase n=1 Tax=Ambrosia artemisiifolia TaxID=4212 RepID=A0AAD5D3B4_AMBAR|nr:hypothetical protein M8C21_028154 [Ambrosia artemisiifolia]